MRYNRKFLFGLLALVFLLSCTQTPEQRAKEATVLIIAGNADGSIGTGSGFFVEHDKIVTNIHVVGSARMVFAVGRKKVYNIENVTGYDPERDVVILKVSGKGKPLELNQGKIDESILAVGYPGGGYEVTEGTIHGIQGSNEQLRLVPQGFPVIRDNSVTSAGNSGGPILNSEGQVIGIAVDSGDVFSSAIASSTLNALTESDGENLSNWQKKKPILAYGCQAWATEKINSGDYEEAIKGFDKAIELYPEYTKVYRRRGGAKVRLRQYEAAIENYTEAIKLIPDNAQYYYNRGNAKLKSGDYTSAIQDFNKALELNPDDADAYSDRGVAKAAELDYIGAIQDYTKAINLNPKDVSVIYYNRGNAKQNSGDYTSAIQDFNKALELNPKYAAGYLNRGVAKAAKRDYEGAIQDYSEAIKLKEAFADAYNKRGNAKKALGGDGNIDYAQAYYYWGKEASNNGNYQLAIKNFDKSIELNPDSAAYYARGNVKQKNGDYRGAIQDYKAAINRKSDYAEAYHELGLTYFRLDNYKVALDYFEKVIKQKPKFAEAHYSIGVTQHRLRDYKEAIDHLSQAIELKQPVIYAKAYMDRWKAKLEYQKELESDPEYKSGSDASETLGEEVDPKVDYAMAHYHWSNEAYKRKQYQKAIENLDKIVELDPLDPKFAPFYDARGNAKIELGKSKVALGDLEGAQQLYQEAIDDYDVAIELDKENGQFYRNRGGTRFLRAALRDHNGMIADYQAALNDFTEAIKWKSDLVDVHGLRGKAQCLLGYAKANHGQLKEARKHYNSALQDFKAAINLDSRNLSHSHYKGLGLASAALGKVKASIDAFEKAKQLEAKSEK